MEAQQPGTAACLRSCLGLFDEAHEPRVAGLSATAAPAALPPVMLWETGGHCSDSTPPGVHTQRCGGCRNIPCCAWSRERPWLYRESTPRPGRYWCLAGVNTLGTHCAATSIDRMLFPEAGAQTVHAANHGLGFSGEKQSVRIKVGRPCGSIASRGLECQSNVVGQSLVKSGGCVGV